MLIEIKFYMQTFSLSVYENKLSAMSDSYKRQKEALLTGKGIFDSQYLTFIRIKLYFIIKRPGINNIRIPL